MPTSGDWVLLFMVTESHSAAAVDDYSLHRSTCEVKSDCVNDEFTAIGFRKS